MTLIAVLLYANLASPDQPIDRPVPHAYGVRDPQFRRTMNQLLGRPIVPGNRVTALLNGDEAFPAMLAAIRSARQSVDLESYIFVSGEVATEFTDALAERARAGVPVHVIVDWLGSKKIDEKLVDRMRSAGITVVKYRPLRWYTLDRFNNRTHRKLLIVDGRVAFTGGIGIDEMYRGHAQDKEHWRDSQFRIEGPAVAEMQAVFLDNWLETDHPLLDGPAYFPALDSVGPELCQAVLSSPGGGTENLRLMFMLAIASAERSILISNAYFVPNTLAVEMLVTARRRGVDVEIIVPGPVSDAKLVERASRAKWGPLLEAGVKIYEYQPTMFHTKVTVVDDYWVSVGSTNFDNRSFRLNDEANLNVLDDAFGREQGEVFARDRARARQVTLEEWRRRPITERLQELVGRMMRHQL
jgi:cardiolipin synthase A/B